MNSQARIPQQPQKTFLLWTGISESYSQSRLIRDQQSRLSDRIFSANHFARERGQTAYDNPLAVFI